MSIASRNMHLRGEVMCSRKGGRARVKQVGRALGRDRVCPQYLLEADGEYHLYLLTYHTEHARSQKVSMIRPG